jgi:biotin synthase
MATLQWRASLLRQRTRLSSNTLILAIPRRFHATQAWGDQEPLPTPRRHWSKSEIKEIYDSPLLELVFRAAEAHRASHDPSKVQLCTLMNIKSLCRLLAYKLPLLIKYLLINSRWML